MIEISLDRFSDRLLNYHFVWSFIRKLDWIKIDFSNVFSVRSCETDYNLTDHADRDHTYLEIALAAPDYH